MPKDTASRHLTRLGKRVKELREKKGLTQTDLALASGVSRVYISGIERGIRNLTVLHLIGIAKGLKVSPQTLLGCWQTRRLRIPGSIPEIRFPSLLWAAVALPIRQACVARAE